ncbi:hypothetical protein D5086_001541 [Populus alba]|uniref:Uncharacterized protein n=1 Tax=Populus alba TaxID=43335 RepID=A0ACC4D1A6_POPAL
MTTVRRQLISRGVFEHGGGAHAIQPEKKIKNGLFGFGIGIHLLRSENPEKMPRKSEINPKDNHISFQCESMGAVEKKLKELGIEHVRALVEEGGIQVEQLFFHDPDGFMIEICNCDNLPVIPLAGEVARSCSCLNLQTMQQERPMLQQERAI